MKKITSDYFYKRIAVKGILDDNKLIVPVLIKEEVNEFRIGNNFYYSIISDEIRSAQREIAYFFSKNIEINNVAIAYRKDYSYFDFLKPHKNNYHFLRLDLVSFFHSISLRLLKKTLKVYCDNDTYLGIEKRQKLIDGILNLITYKIPDDSKNEKFIGKTVLPMGFITSPIISNIIFRQLDIVIQKYCLSKNIVYTRYADDMLFSSAYGNKFIHSESFEKEIAIFLASKDFKLNKKKTIRTNHTISLNGYTIQSNVKHARILKKIILDYRESESEIRLSNKKLIVIKKTIYLIEKKENFEKILSKVFKVNLRKTLVYRNKEKYAEKYAKSQIINKLCGYRAFILSIIVYHGKNNILKHATFQKYSNLVSEIEDCLNKI